MLHDIIIAFNNALQIIGNGELSPRFFKCVENRLKNKHDKRFKLFVLAASNNTAIVKYKGGKYYINYDFKTHQYVGETMN